jgi:hypothetical protein
MTYNNRRNIQQRRPYTYDENELGTLAETSCSNKITFNKIMLIFKEANRTMRIENADLCLSALNHVFIKRENSSNFDWKAVGEQLKLYITLKIELRKFSLENLLFYLESVLSAGWGHMISPFVKEFSLTFEDCITNLDNIDERERQSISLIRIYFYLFLKWEGQSLLSKTFDLIVQGKLIRLDTKLLIELFQIIFCLEEREGYTSQMEHLLVNITEGMPYIECYKIYQDVLNSRCDYGKGKAEIHKIFQKHGLEKDKMAKRYYKVIEYKIRNSDAKFADLKLNAFNDKSRTQNKTKRIKFTNGVLCPVCNRRMKRREGKILYMNPRRESRNSNITEYVKSDVLFCQSCKEVYSDDYNLANDKYVIDENVFKDENLDRYKVKEEADATKSYSNSNGFEYSEHSQLSRLGYSTKLTREERKDILLNKALKKMGKEKIISFLKFLISSRESIKDRDFSSAINSWKTDLDMLMKVKD